MELTKECIQKKIDHYAAFRDAYHTMCQETEDKDKTPRYHDLMMYYGGKSDAWTDLYNELFPEMDGKRAFPYSKEAHDMVVQDVIVLEKDMATTKAGVYH